MRGLNQDLGKIHLSILGEIKCCIRLKGLDVNLNIAGVERICSENLCLVKTEGHLILVLNERSISDGGNLCHLWLVILKSV